eukprot:3702970-Amphidinium_carterae.2
MGGRPQCSIGECAIDWRASSYGFSECAANVSLLCRVEWYKTVLCVRRHCMMFDRGDVLLDKCSRFLGSETEVSYCRRLWYGAQICRSDVKGSHEICAGWCSRGLLYTFLGLACHVISVGGNSIVHCGVASDIAIWNEGPRLSPSSAFVVPCRMDPDNPEEKARLFEEVDCSIEASIGDVDVREVGEVLGGYGSIFREIAAAVSVARHMLGQVISQHGRQLEEMWQTLWDTSFKGKYNREKDAGALAAKAEYNAAEGEKMTKAALIVTMTYMAETREALTPPYDDCVKICAKKQAKRVWDGLLKSVNVLSRLDEYPRDRNERRTNDRDQSKGQEGAAPVQYKAMPVRKRGREVNKQQREHPEQPPERDGDLDETSSRDDGESSGEEGKHQESGKHALFKAWYGLEFKEQKKARPRKANHSACSSFDMDDAAEVDGGSAGSGDLQNAPWRTAPKAAADVAPGECSAGIMTEQCPHSRYQGHVVPCAGAGKPSQYCESSQCGSQDNECLPSRPAPPPPPQRTLSCNELPAPPLAYFCNGGFKRVPAPPKRALMWRLVFCHDGHSAPSGVSGLIWSMVFDCLCCVCVCFKGWGLSRPVSYTKADCHMGCAAKHSAVAVSARWCAQWCCRITVCDICACGCEECMMPSTRVIWAGAERSKRCCIRCCQHCPHVGGVSMVEWGRSSVAATLHPPTPTTAICTRMCCLTGSCYWSYECHVGGICDRVLNSTCAGYESTGAGFHDGGTERTKVNCFLDGSTTSYNALQSGSAATMRKGVCSLWHSGVNMWLLHVSDYGAVVCERCAGAFSTRASDVMIGSINGRGDPVSVHDWWGSCGASGHGMNVRKVSADGRCMYRSIAVSQGMNENQWRAVVVDILEHMQSGGWDATVPNDICEHAVVCARRALRHGELPRPFWPTEPHLHKPKESTCASGMKPLALAKQWHAYGDEGACLSIRYNGVDHYDALLRDLVCVGPDAGIGSAAIPTVRNGSDEGDGASKRKWWLVTRNVSSWKQAVLFLDYIRSGEAGYEPDVIFMQEHRMEGKTGEATVIAQLQRSGYRVAFQSAKRSEKSGRACGGTLIAVRARFGIRCEHHEQTLSQVPDMFRAKWYSAWRGQVGVLVSGSWTGRRGPKGRSPPSVYATCVGRCSTLHYRSRL